MNEPEKDDERPPRTNVFVMATLYFDGGSAPVKIRNISSLGALVEGPHIPVQGAPISLRRGSLDVPGTVAWLTDGRAGLKFDAPTSVAPWLPGGEKMLQQGRIDAIFHSKRTQSAASSSFRPISQPPVTLAEIVKVKEMLESVAEALIEDVVMVSRHGIHLQSLDFAIQMLGRLAPVLNNSESIPD